MNPQTNTCQMKLESPFSIDPQKPIKGIVSLYGKVGCKGNARQMLQLQEAGYAVQFIDLFNRKLEASELQKFFAGRSIYECVNPRAPQVASGDFQPEQLDESVLLEAMIQDPTLIKRPLLFFRGEFACGADHPLMARLLGDVPPDLGCQGHDACHHS